MNLPILDILYNEIIWYTILSDWLLALSPVSARFMNVVTFVTTSFLYGPVMFHCITMTIHLLIHPLMGIWIISTFWLLWIILLWTFSYKVLCGHVFSLGFPGSASGKEAACQCSKCKRCRFNPLIGKIPWRKAWQPTPVFLPGESHGRRSLVGSSPWSCKESDVTEAT